MTRPVVGHFVPAWLPRTETFIHRTITHFERYRPVVVAQHRVPEGREFAGPEVHSRAELESRFSLHRWRRSFESRVHGRHLDAYASLLRHRGAGLLHVHFGHTGAEALPVSQRLGLPQVTSFYGYDDSVPMRDPSRREAFLRLFDDGACVLVEGPHIAARLVAAGCPEEKVRIHRIGVDLKLLTPTPIPAPEGRLRLLFCGRLVDKKGAPDAIEAIRALRDRGVAAELRLLGDGPQRETLREAVREAELGDRVHLLGSGNYRRFLEELASCHALLQPSRVAADGETEGGAPTVILEAQAAGRPVVATEHADIPFIVRAGESALLAPERSPEALADLLEDLARRPERWEAMGRAGRAQVEAHHDARQLGRELESLYDELRAGG